MKRHTMRKPMMLMAWARPAIACAKVAMMMMQSSTPSEERGVRRWKDDKRGKAHTHAFTTDDIGEPTE